MFIRPVQQRMLNVCSQNLRLSVDTDTAGNSSNMAFRLLWQNRGGEAHCFARPHAQDEHIVDYYHPPLSFRLLEVYLVIHRSNFSFVHFPPQLQMHPNTTGHLQNTFLL